MSQILALSLLLSNYRMAPMPKIIYKPQAVCDVDENISQLEMKRERKSREIMSKLAQRKEEVGKSNSKCFLFFFKGSSILVALLGGGV